MPDMFPMSGRMSARKIAFAHRYVEDPKRNGTQAAISSGYSAPSARGTASRLLNRDQGVIDLIASLEGDMQARHQVTTDSLTDEVEAAMKIATDAKDAKALNSLLVTKAKLHGKIIDRAQVEVNEFDSMTSEQIHKEAIKPIIALLPLLPDERLFECAALYQSEIDRRAGGGKQ